MIYVTGDIHGEVDISKLNYSKFLTSQGRRLFDYLWRFWIDMGYKTKQE